MASAELRIDRDTSRRPCRLIASSTCVEAAEGSWGAPTQILSVTDCFDHNAEAHKES